MRFMTCGRTIGLVRSAIWRYVDDARDPYPGSSPQRSAGSVATRCRNSRSGFVDQHALPVNTRVLEFDALMALFGFNKQKVLASAEKYVQQGKLTNAISEYEKILKNDPKDLTVTNTVGDLYSRIGESDKATDCFKSVGDAYAGQGFTVKAIAMYKKICKLKPSLESLLKLAELYTQQGLFNDARAQYLQVAEEFLKAGELDNAVRIFQKILEMDPENSQMRVKLAEVYVRLGKKNEAWQIFSAAAETLRNRGSRSGAEEILQRMLTLDPGNSYALLLRGRNALEAGDAGAAIPFFEKVADIDNHPDGLRDLLKVYLQTGRVSDAGALAEKLLTAHNDVESMFSYIHALVQSGSHEIALEVIDQDSDRLLADNSAKVLEILRAVIGHVSGNVPALEKLLQLFHQAGDQSHINEVNELLAHACVQSGDLSKARDLYQTLAEQEPQNPMHMQNCQQVVGMMGGSTGSKLLTVEEGIVLVEELETTAPPVDQAYSPEVAAALRAALTDTELFISYNMPDKALGPLMAVLPIAPNDVRLNQRLAALHTRAERFADAAVCCRTLQAAYAEAGLTEEASRYGDLAQRCEERTASAPARFSSPADSEALLPPWPAAPNPEGLHAVETAAEMPVQADSEFEVANDEGASEIDLSAEWDGATVEAVSPEPIHESEPTVEVTNEAHIEPAVEEISAETSDAVNETIEEIRFYLEHSMVDQARAAFVKLQSQTADYEQLAAIHAEIDAATPKVEPEPEPAEAVSEIAEPAPIEPEVEVAHAPVPEPEPEPEPEHASPLNKMVAELDSSFGDGFLGDTATHEIVHDEQPVAHAATDPSLVGHLEFMAGPKLKPKPAPAPEPAAAAHAKPAPAPAAPERHMAASAVAGPGTTPKIAVPTAPIAAVAA